MAPNGVRIHGQEDHEATDETERVRDRYSRWMRPFRMTSKSSAPSRIPVQTGCRDPPARLTPPTTAIAMVANSHPWPRNPETAPVCIVASAAGQGGHGAGQHEAQVRIGPIAPAGRSFAPTPCRCRWLSTLRPKAVLAVQQVKGDNEGQHDQRVEINRPQNSIRPMARTSDGSKSMTASVWSSASPRKAIMVPSVVIRGLTFRTTHNEAVDQPARQRRCPDQHEQCGDRTEFEFFQRKRR